MPCKQQVCSLDCVSEGCFSSPFSSALCVTLLNPSCCPQLTSVFSLSLKAVLLPFLSSSSHSSSLMCVFLCHLQKPILFLALSVTVCCRRHWLHVDDISAPFTQMTGAKKEGQGGMGGPEVIFLTFSFPCQGGM